VKLGSPSWRRLLRSRMRKRSLLLDDFYPVSGHRI
jgi:hypothetical protein